MGKVSSPKRTIGLVSPKVQMQLPRMVRDTRMIKSSPLVLGEIPRPPPPEPIIGYTWVWDEAIDQWVKTPSGAIPEPGDKAARAAARARAKAQKKRRRIPEWM